MELDGSTNMFDFGEALDRLRDGGTVARAGWNGLGMHLRLQNPTDTSMMRKPYIYIKPVDGLLVPWTASQTDILAQDWYQVD